MDLSPHHPFRSAKAREQYLEFYEKKTALWPIQAECKTVSTTYGETFVRVGGPVGAPPLVLLPGGSANSLMWWPNIEALSGAFRTYAIDNLYDFGRSRYVRKPANPGDILAWLNELFDGLDLGKDIRMMGLSLGGWMVSQYALRFPERLKKVILLSPANTVLPIRPEFALRAVLTLVPFRFLTKSFLYWLFEDLVHKEEAGGQLADDLVGEMFLSFQCFKRMPIINPTVLTDDDLQTFKVPALFLVGENEKIYPAQEAVERLNRLAPQIKSEIIPHAGHDLTMVQAEMVDDKILEFLKGP